MTDIHLDPLLNEKHKALFQSKSEMLFVRGGANAGKTYSIADKLILQGLRQPGKQLKALTVRKTFPSLRRSVLDIIERRAKAFNVDYKLNKSDWEALAGNVKFVFVSMNNSDDRERVKSITDVDYIWCNEVNELRADDIDLLMTRLRGGESDFSQFIGDFNPTGKGTWLYKNYFTSDQPGVEKLKYTIDDNRWASTIELQRLEKMKERNPNYYQVYRLGEWGELKGVIYNWDVVELPDIGFDEIWYGGDFGYSVDPTAIVKIYRKSNEIWLEEILYRTGLTNIQMARGLKGNKDFDIDAKSYWDSAEPKSIQELCDLGINAHPAIKGPDSVQAGIDFLMTLKIHIVKGSENLIDERNAYCWDVNKDGEQIPKPIDFFNHLMDASRYGIYSHMRDNQTHFWSVN